MSKAAYANHHVHTLIRLKYVTLAACSLIILCCFSNISLAQDNPAGPPLPSTEGMKTGEICGQLIAKGGGSMEGGSVLLYSAEKGPPPNLASFLRVPNVIREVLPNGTFCVELPAGEYYLLAVKRNSGKKYGRPQKGDYWFRFREKDSTELRKIRLLEGRHIDLGVLEALPRPGKKGLQFTNKTSITGSISDSEGNPVPNVAVFAFATPQMQGQKPLYVSDFTGTDGKYILKVSGDSTYYLMARDIMGGGQVQEGGLIGSYGGPEPLAITVKSGETVKGIEIRVARMRHRGPELPPIAENNSDLNKRGAKKPALLPENGPATPENKSAP